MLPLLSPARSTLPALFPAPPGPRTPPVLGEVVAAVSERPDLWRPHVRFDPARRWSMRLHADDDLDVWLISWTPDQSTALHDHGGSAGVLTVVDGGLTELTVAPKDLHRLLRHELALGQVRTFGPRHIHDVVNTGAAPAVSVHAYSPPLRSMTYYATGAYGVRKVRTVLT